MYHSLPVDAIIPELSRHLAENENLVVTAEPGSGKTTRIPPACLSADWLGSKRILLLEPRRIAARAAACYMASQCQSRVGDLIGYRVRGDSRVSQATRLEVVTEGILTRMIQDDPSLEKIGMIIFDEFHERSLHVDLALALALEVQRVLRPDLRLLIMSATINAEEISTLIGNARIIRCPGRLFPVESRYLAKPFRHHIAQEVIAVIERAVRDEGGDILVFLPGRGEISRITDQILGMPHLTGLDVLPLHSEIRGEEQDQVLNPGASARRRIILATNIAETSVTIPGVRVVIDAGLVRVPRFNASRGISGLETISVSLASAHQRAGRAGRLQPGVCYRLWTEREHQELSPYHDPEILHADLAPFLLELAAWGSIDISEYSFLNYPAESQLRVARDLLLLLGAIDEKGKISAHGSELLRLAVHPRFAHLLLRARQQGLAVEACDVIALLQEPSIPGDRELNQILSNRFESLQQLRRSRGKAGGGVLRRVDQEARRLRQLISIGEGKSTKDTRSFGKLVALIYPERIAQQREVRGNRFLMRSGSGAIVGEKSMLTRHSFLAIAHLDGGGNDARVFLAEPISEADLEALCSDAIEKRTDVYWDVNTASVRARQIRALGALVLSEAPIAISDEQAIPVILDEIHRAGLQVIPFRHQVGSFRDRIEWLRGRDIDREQLPDLSDRALLDHLDQWLTGFLQGVRSLSALSHLSLDQVISSMLSYQIRELVSHLAPVDIVLPSGRAVPIDYKGERAPSISARLQELFGQKSILAIAEGKIPLTIHLLSPAGRPLQVTSDLHSFWKNSYHEVRKEMQGRYPKHAWPLNPLEAQAMRGSKNIK